MASRPIFAGARSPNLGEPLYSKRLPGRVVIGLVVRTCHCNGSELLHGDLISALADDAMGLSCMTVLQARGEAQIRGMVTVSLLVEFLGQANFPGQAKVGQWLAFDMCCVTVGKRLSVRRRLRHRRQREHRAHGRVFRAPRP